MFFHHLDIKACLYCQSQFTFNLKDYFLFSFDHFYSKKDYFFLSLSPYNLIPSCANCNQFKGIKKYKLSTHYHPLVDDIHSNYEVQVDRKDELKLLLNPFTKDQIRIMVKRKNDGDRLRNFLRDFKVEGIVQCNEQLISGYSG
jgi:hypothetical protein